MRNLVFVDGYYQDATTGERFVGVVPRDLDIGDIYDPGTGKRIVTSKEIVDDGIILIRSQTVGE